MRLRVEKIELPKEAFYTKNHEWLTIDENTATIGLTAYITDKVGEILYIDLPEEGDKISLNNLFAEIESARHVIDLIGSFSGTILEINHELLENPSLINDDPYGTGWILRAELDNEKDLADLLRQAEYKLHIKNNSFNQTPADSSKPTMTEQP